MYKIKKCVCGAGLNKYLNMIFKVIRYQYV